MIDFDALPLIVSRIREQYISTTPLEQWIAGMTHDPSEPIDECLKECTAAERKAIAERTPPYDGVWTWHDLLVVREAKKDEHQNDNA